MFRGYSKGASELDKKREESPLGKALKRVKQLINYIDRLICEDSKELDRVLPDGHDVRYHSAYYCVKEVEKTLRPFGFTDKDIDALAGGLITISQLTVKYHKEQKVDEKN